MIKYIDLLWNQGVAMLGLIPNARSLTFNHPIELDAS